MASILVVLIQGVFRKGFKGMREKELNLFAFPFWLFAMPKCCNIGKCNAILKNFYMPCGNYLNLMWNEPSNYSNKKI